VPRSFGLALPIVLGGLLFHDAGCSTSVVPSGGEPDAMVMMMPSPDSGHPSGDLTSPAADAGKAPPPLVCPPVPAPYVPPTYVPAIAYQGLCTTEDIDDFISACVDPGQACATWYDDNVPNFVPGKPGTACGNCVLAPIGQNNGAMWTDPERLFGPNYAGCMQILDPSHDTACPSAFNDLTACQALTCEYCPGQDAGDYMQCIDAADSAICAPLAATEGSVCGHDFAVGGVFDMCSPSNGGTADYVFLANLICGAAPVLDAGAEAGPDGAGDAGSDAAGD
jgi:hypothetical protein